jgi:hypothetical protein
VGRHAPRTGRRRLRAWSVVTVVVLLAAGTAGVVAAGPRRLVDRMRAVVAQTSCTPTVVRVDASPAISSAVRTVLDGQEGRQLADGSCLQVVVRGVTPDQVVAGARSAAPAAGTADLDRLPELWIPDATLWVRRMPAAVPVTVEKSLARSPVILTTSAAAVRRLGWTVATPPRWAQAVTGAHPVAVDLTTDTCGLAVAAALRATIRDETQFDRALAALSLAVDRGTPHGGEAPLDLASIDAPGTPLMPDTEQAVLNLRRSGQDSLAMIYPADGSPILDYPLVRVAPGRRSAAAEAAVATVASSLRAPAAAATFAAQGFRLPGKGAPAGVDVRQDPIRALDMPPAVMVDRIVAQLTTLAAPTRMLALIDISGSMDAAVSDGVTRISLVRDAASAALRLLPADNSVGAWVFASRLGTVKGLPVDWRALSPMDRLGASDGAATHRDRILADLRTLPDQTRGSGGTAIYDTVDAAVRQMQDTYDGSAANVVVLLTDGVNADSSGLSLDEVVDRLEAGKGGGAVRLIAIGIGSDVDESALQRLAGATEHGKAYVVVDPKDLQTVLFDALANRT